jgi:hypothetical protein
MYEPLNRASEEPDELKEDQIDDLEESMVVADMEGLAPQRPLLFPRFDSFSSPSEEGRRPVDIDREGRRAAIWGALSAVLLIWALYAVLFGLFILVLVKFVLK